MLKLKDLKDEWECYDCGKRFPLWNVAALHADDYGHQIQRVGGLPRFVEDLGPDDGQSSDLAEKKNLG